MNSKSEKLEEEKSVTKEETNASEKCLTAPRVKIEDEGKTQQLEPRRAEKKTRKYGLYAPPCKEDLGFLDIFDFWKDGSRDLYLVVEPTDFAVHSEKGLQVKIKSPSKHPQDLIVTCNSYLFEIKNARGYGGMESQIFHRVKKDETIVIDIGLREPNSYPREHEIDKLPASVTGFLEISHYRTRGNKGDDDVNWNIQEPTQMVRSRVPHSNETYGFNRIPLKLEQETEEVKRRQRKFMLVNFLHLEMRAYGRGNGCIMPGLKMTEHPGEQEERDEKTDLEAEAVLDRGIEAFAEAERRRQAKEDSNCCGSNCTIM